MGKKENEKELLAEVSGMKIYSNSVYVVTGKSDEGAPTGFQEMGIAKAPFPGNKGVVQCSWDKYLRVYDTGFFESSMCYKSMTKDEAKLEVQRRIKNIKDLYESSTGNDLDQRNFDFWDSLTVSVYDGRMFYTNDISDLFDLYIALQSKGLTPKSEDGNPDFQNSMYCVEDKTTAVDIKKQRQIDKTEIIYKFMSSFSRKDDERQSIIDLLIYLDIIQSAQMDDSMIRYMFTTWLESKNTNIDLYKEAYDTYITGNKDADESVKDVIKYHRMIKELAYAGEVKMNSSGVTIDSIVLGPDFISSARNLAINNDLIEVRASLLEKYNEWKDKQKKK